MYKLTGDLQTNRRQIQLALCKHLNCSLSDAVACVQYGEIHIGPSEVPKALVVELKTLGVTMTEKNGPDADDKKDIKKEMKSLLVVAIKKDDFAKAKKLIDMLISA
jgi:hypothetical protein